MKTIAATLFLAGAAFAQDTPSDVAIPAIFGSPLLLTLIQGGLLTLMAISVHYIGRAFGGGGELPGAVALVAWLQFLMVCLQVLQGLSMILLPGPAGDFVGSIAIAVVLMLIWSLIVALTVTPALAGWVLPRSASSSGMAR